MKGPSFEPPPCDLDRLLDNLLMVGNVFEGLSTTSDQKAP